MTGSACFSLQSIGESLGEHDPPLTAHPHPESCRRILESLPSWVQPVFDLLHFLSIEQFEGQQNVKSIPSARSNLRAMS